MPGLRRLARSGDDHAVNGPPALMVARTFSGGPARLGLDAPLPLHGANALPAERSLHRLGLDWLPDLTDAIVSACETQLAEGRPWLTLPAMALSGPEGSGRTHIARRMAGCFGVPLVTIDVAGPSGADGLRRMLPAPCTPLPPVPVLAMAATGCANPVILVTGADDIEDDAAGLLGAMLDPAIARSWVDEALEATLDLSHVSWLVATHDADALHPSLGGGLLAIDVAGPSNREAAGTRLRVLSIVAEAAQDLGVDPSTLSVEPAALLDSIVSASMWSGSASAIHGIVVDRLRSLAGIRG